MTLVVWHMDCEHAQDVLLNCFDFEDALPYVKKAEKRGTCKSCGRRLGKLMIVVLEGSAEEPALNDPFAIDLSKR